MMRGYRCSLPDFFRLLSTSNDALDSIPLVSDRCRVILSSSDICPSHRTNSNELSRLHQLLHLLHCLEGLELCKREFSTCLKFYVYQVLTRYFERYFLRVSRDLVHTIHPQRFLLKPIEELIF